MTDFEPELAVVRNRIVRIEEELQAEIQRITDEATARTMAAVRKAEQAAAPLRGIIYAIESSQVAPTDSPPQGHVVTTVATAQQAPRPTLAAAAPQAPLNQEERVRARKPSAPVPGDEADESIRSSISSPPAAIAKTPSPIPARAAGQKPETKEKPGKVEGTNPPQSARHLILSILKREGKPVPFPVLDHAVMDAGMTRSAGEKSRRTMWKTGVANRVDNSLEINEKGEQVLAELEKSSRPF